MYIKIHKVYHKSEQELLIKNKKGKNIIIIREKIWKSNNSQNSTAFYSLLEVFCKFQNNLHNTIDNIKLMSFISESVLVLIFL